MDLGIGLLTDDQLIELLQEACVELGNRDPFLRKMAQSVITDEAERLELKKEAMISAVAKVRKRYRHDLEIEVIRALNKEVTDGEWAPITPEEEGRLISTTTQKFKNDHRKHHVQQLQAKIKDELHAKVLAGIENIYSPAEQQSMIDDATAGAVEWLKRRAVIPIEMFKHARRAIFDNLRRMGHSDEDILSVYGLPEKKEPEPAAPLSPFAFHLFLKKP